MKKKSLSNLHNSQSLVNFKINSNALNSTNHSNKSIKESSQCNYPPPSSRAEKYDNDDTFLRSYRNTNKQPRINVFQLQNDNKSLNVSLDKMNEVNSMLSLQIYQMSSERRTMIDAVQSSTEAITRLENNLQKSYLENEKHQEIIAKLNDEIISMRKEKEDNTQEMNGLKNKCDDLLDRNTFLIEQFEQYQRKITETENSMKIMQSQMEKYCQLNNKYNEVLKEKENMNKKIMIEMETKKEVVSNNEDLDIRKENIKLKKNLDLFYKENHAASIKIKELEEKVKDLLKHQIENEMLHSMITELKERILTMQKDIITLKKNKRI